MSLDIVNKKLDNGATLYIVPKKGYVEKQAMVAVNYGSSDNIIIKGDKKTEYPLGIAHFLEHKLFEEKDINIFDEFSKLGANTNAFTNFNTTAYYFNAVDNFDKCLEILLKFVSNIYLTEENVEKEKGIISQEIIMYDDDPMWQVYFNLIGALYKKHPIRNNIAGDVKSVEGTTKDMLEECYNTFYTVENIAIIVAGDVDCEDVVKGVEKHLKLGKGEDVERDYGKECEGINKPYVSAKMQVKRPIFNIGYKENQFDLDIVDRIVCSRMLLDIMFGNGSRFYERLYSEGLIDASFGYDYLSGDTYGVSIISGISDKPLSVQKEVLREVERFKKEGVTDEEVDRIRKKHLGRLEKSGESISGICSMIADNFCKGIEVLDFYKKYDNINSDILMDRLKTCFVEENMAISVIESK